MDADEEVVTAEPVANPSWQETWRSFDVDPLLAEAVVWPETVRYRKLQDLMETAANYGSYITTGKGPDYSIGIFQMKPSFVEDLEKAWMRSGLARQYECCKVLRICNSKRIWLSCGISGSLYKVSGMRQT